MTLKILISGTPLIRRSYGAGKTFAWYVTRRLQQV